MDVSVLIFYCTFSQCIIFLCEYLLVPFLEKFGITIQIRKLNYRKEYFIVIFFFIGLVCFLHYVQEKLYHLSIVLCLCTVWIIVDQCLKNSIVDINNCQKDEISIGAFWAHQAYEYYYKIVLETLTERIEIFERKHNITLYVRKFILLVPLSCDITGTLDTKDDFIEYIGDLRIDECDQGANVNRKYKNPVYKIKNPVYKIHVNNTNPITAEKKYVNNEDIYVVAEFPSPLGTLFKTKRNFLKEIWNYHRQCFIKTMRFLTKRDPFILVEYNDTASESLSNALIAAIKKENSVPDIIIE